MKTRKRESIAVSIGEVGSALKQIRKAANFDQVELAIAMGLKPNSNSMFSRFEHGADSPTAKTMDKIAKACGYSLMIVFVPDDDE